MLFRFRVFNNCFSLRLLMEEGRKAWKSNLTTLISKLETLSQSMQVAVLLNLCLCDFSLIFFVFHYSQNLQNQPKTWSSIIYLFLYALCICHVFALISYVCYGCARTIVIIAQISYCLFSLHHLIEYDKWSIFRLILLLSVEVLHASYNLLDYLKMWVSKHLHVHIQCV